MTANNLQQLEAQMSSILDEASQAIDESTKTTTLQQIKSNYLGKNSYINKILQQIAAINTKTTIANNDFKVTAGKLINTTKQAIIKKISTKIAALENAEINQKLQKEIIDVTLPALNLTIGHRNPLYIIRDKIINFFVALNYDIINGTEVDNEEYNFNRLNLKPDHPAREMHDTFYIKNVMTNINNRWLLRTHCTNMTARILSEKSTTNLRDTIGFLSVGNVYRKDDDDATHSHQFMQIDGFLVGSNVSFANLKWTLEQLCQTLFGAESQIRLRPSYFPFTEPSVEVDVSCPLCLLKGCYLCKASGWIEILGAGQIHPHVFSLCNINAQEIKGFAFGLGIERMAMIIYQIDDIRLFYQNDYRFLQQF